MFECECDTLVCARKTFKMKWYNNFNVSINTSLSAISLRPFVTLNCVCVRELVTKCERKRGKRHKVYIFIRAKPTTILIGNLFLFSVWFCFLVCYFGCGGLRLAIGKMNFINRNMYCLTVKWIKNPFIQPQRCSINSWITPFKWN